MKIQKFDLNYAYVVVSEGRKEVSEENIRKLMDAAGIVVDPFVLSVTQPIINNEIPKFDFFTEEKKLFNF